jgi:ABC-type spermidine/putrescine transport system permease subunit II
MFFALGYVVTLVLMQPSLAAGVVLTFILSVAQAAILWSRPIKALVSDATSALEPLGR